MRTLLFSTAFFDIVTDILLKVSGSIWKDLMYDEFRNKIRRVIKESGKESNEVDMKSEKILVKVT